MVSDRVSDCFLVCGLGSLGQHCVGVLASFGVRVRAIEQVLPGSWDLPDLPLRLEQLITGDFCRSEVLHQAGLADCRAILLLAGDDRVNLKAALAARLLNPAVRLVLRSNRPHLNELLAQQFGNFVAFEPSQLSATSFALAALQDETIGAFEIDRLAYRVRQRVIQAGDAWVGCTPASLNTRSLLFLGCWASSQPLQPDQVLYRWHPTTPLQAGDWVAYAEAHQGSHWHEFDFYTRQPTAADPPHPAARARRWAKGLQGAWQEAQSTLHRSRLVQMALLYVGVVLGLLAIGTVLLRLYYPRESWFDAFCDTTVLLLGGYADLFGDPGRSGALPQWLRLFGLSLAVVGTGLVGVLYALLTERLLSLRLRFAPRRPRPPEGDRILVVGMGQVGQRIAQLILQAGRAVVGLTRQGLEDHLLPELPLVVGALPMSLQRADLSRVQSVALVTDDEIMNLEMALMVRQANAQTSLVIRTFDRAFSDTLVGLLPEAQVLCAYALAAEAFAGAAFGENILSLFRWGNTTLLVTEYLVEPGDTLVGLLLAEFACGYAAVPLRHERANQGLGREVSGAGFPRLDRRLQTGDRLVVLSTIDGLRRIERGELAPRRWYVRLRSASSEASFEGANAVTRFTGCSLGEVRALFDRLPTLVTSGDPPIPYAMYEYQARSLVLSLSKSLVEAEVLPAIEDRLN